MSDLLIFIFFFILICLFSVLFVGMALWEHHSSELEFDWDPTDGDRFPYMEEEDNVIFRG